MISRLSLLAVLALAAMFAAPAEGRDAGQGGLSRPPAAIGELVQLSGSSGCLVDRSRQTGRCTRARVLRGPGPFLGSNAIAISPDAKHAYVASSNSDAIAVFKRSSKTGALSQASGADGCVAERGAAGCATAVGLHGPNSVAVSADGRNVYATSVDSNAVTGFSRNRSTGALTQIDSGGCIASAAARGCAPGRALDGPDVVTVSPDGENVYVGAFKGNAVAVFARNPSTGALTQPADTTGCVTDTPTTGCATGLALAAPEGMAISADGDNVYVAAANSSAVDVFTRDPATGALAQATDGSGCIVDRDRPECTTGRQLGGANAVAVGPDDGNVYVTSLLSNSVTTFTRGRPGGGLTQLEGTTGCVVYLAAVGCSLGQAMSAPEGLAVSPDGANVYAAAFESGSVDVLDRDPDSGTLVQKPRRAGCVAVSSTPNCTPGRRLLGVSSLAVSPDGRYVYATAFTSSAVAVFERATG